MAQFHVWLEIEILYGKLARTQPHAQSKTLIASRMGGGVQFLYDYCPTTAYAGLAYVGGGEVQSYIRTHRKPDKPRDRHDRCRLEGPPTRTGTHHGRRPRQRRGGVRPRGGGGFASKRSRQAVCGGISQLVGCHKIAPRSSPPAHHAQNCDEVLVATEPEVNAAAFMAFVLLLVTRSSFRLSFALGTFEISSPIECGDRSQRNAPGVRGAAGAPLEDCCASQ